MIYITLLDIYEVGRSDQYPNWMPLPRVGETIDWNGNQYSVTDIQHQPNDKSCNIFIHTKVKE